MFYEKVVNKIVSVSALVDLSFPFIAHASDSQYAPSLEGIEGSVLPPPGMYYRGYSAN